MSRRTLVFVLGLTVGDYLLWSWSLNGNHDVIALASGLTLPPLALASCGCSRSAPPSCSPAPPRAAPAPRGTRAPHRAQATRPAAGRGRARARTRRAQPARSAASAPQDRRLSAAGRRVSDRSSASLAPHSAAASSRSCWWCSLAARVGVYLYERGRTGNVYHPHARFVPEPTPTLPAKRPRPLRLAVVRLHQGTHALLPGLAERCARPSAAVGAQRPRAARVPARDLRRTLFQLADNGELVAIDKHNGHRSGAQARRNCRPRRPPSTRKPSTRRCSPAATRRAGTRRTR